MYMVGMNQGLLTMVFDSSRIVSRLPCGRGLSSRVMFLFNHADSQDSCIGIFQICLVIKIRT